MPSPRLIVLSTAAIASLALAARAMSGLAEGSPDAPEPGPRALSQPWQLGEAQGMSVALDAEGRSSLGWSADRPMAIEARHELGDGLSAHLGAEALAPVGAGGLAARAPDWQAGVALRQKLDDRWTASFGAGWRTASGAGLGSFVDGGRQTLSDGGGGGEGVVWLRFTASF